MENDYKEEITEHLKKSQLCAKTQEDFEKIMEEQPQFLSCQIIQEEETVDIIYDIREKQPVTELHREGRINRLRALLELPVLEEVFTCYHFCLSPENLYYDRNYRVYVKERDLRERGVSGSPEEFLLQYKALSAYMLQNRYSFEDYYAGGSDLYRKNPLLKQICEADTKEAVRELLLGEYKRVEDILYHKTIEVDRSHYKTLRWGMGISICLVLALVAYIVTMLYVELPRKNAFLEASDSYLSNNYIQVIDALEDVDIKHMDKYQKYMLAVSFIKGESLTPNQKENILDKLTIDGEEKQMDYWIYLGRLNVVEAENIAMQQSDQELLLYAYMTEKAVVEKDTQLSGEDKVEKLDSLEKKITELAKQYEDTQEEQ